MHEVAFIGRGGVHVVELITQLRYDSESRCCATCRQLDSESLTLKGARFNAAGVPVDGVVPGEFPPPAQSAPISAQNVVKLLSIMRIAWSRRGRPGLHFARGARRR